MNQINDKGIKPLVYLRALEMEDLEFLYKIENDRSLWGVGCTNVPYSRQMLIDYIASASADIYADRQMRLIIEDGQQKTVGMIDLVNFDHCYQGWISWKRVCSRGNSAIIGIF